MGGPPTDFKSMGVWRISGEKKGEIAGENVKNNIQKIV
jgi:hypothetical protein